ncbi:MULTISPECIES: hypothetical protein [Bacillus]|uniref:Uncharacterized protein n=1 Tax=Bacillus capparidis TaxID=1840411 RepID=A0ABS4CV78_9BACI|nr:MULTISPECIES: hypothetical protein [Bacillus]MBP1081474.1 hypothetical protein [Bacillus capparidis]MED1096141.1 hypothetical protein [Bacillus capparidis]
MIEPIGCRVNYRWKTKKEVGAGAETKIGLIYHECFPKGATFCDAPWS